MRDEELSWLDDVFSKVNEELNEAVAALGSVPLRYLGSGVGGVSSVEAHTERLRRALKREAHAEDFIALEALGRVRLSDETRRAELKRLKRKWKRRKTYKFKYGRKHHKQKEKTRKEYNNRRWERQPLERLKYTSRKPVHITQEEWDRCIQPIWKEYDRKWLKLKCSEPKMTIYNLIIEYHPPKERYARKKPRPIVVYNGYDQAVYDSLNTSQSG